MKNLYGQINYLVIIHLMLILYVSSQEARANLPSINIITIFQQQVTGTVTDQNGIPIPGVAVRIKESSVGTVTNADGNYSLTVSSEDVLVFTYMGFQPMEILVDDQREINVRLEEDITALGEVEINAGYYYTTRGESTGNISRVTAEEIELQPVVSPIQAIQGRMAGIEIVPGPGGHPGAASGIRIRGTNSLRPEGNYPLYIIDGVPVNSTPIESYSSLRGSGIDPLSTMNLANIESIEVLKDADATAIYGSRGANGVVLITTKRGRKGEVEIKVRGYTGISDVPYRVDLLETERYLEVRKKAFDNDAIEPTVANAYDLLVWDSERYTDWQEIFFGGTSEITDMNISVFGGTENNSFRFTGSYANQGTVFIGDYNYSRITGSLQAQHSSKDQKFNMNLSTNYGVDVNKLVGYLDLTSGAFSLPPNAPEKLLNEDGSLHWEEWGEVGLNNPLEGYHNSSLSRGYNLNSNLVVNYELIKGLTLKTNLGYSSYNRDEVVKRPLKSFNPNIRQYLTNRSTHQNASSFSWIVEPQLILTKRIGKNHIEALVGGTFQLRESENVNLEAEGFVSESVIGNLSAADNIRGLADEFSEYKYSAIFARIGYNWDRKYYLNLTGRRDGSSRFGPGNRIANFGAVGAAWVFSEELFFKNSFSFLSFGKLRGSYGSTGNDQIGEYGYLDAYEVTVGPGGLYPNQLANPDYSWEVNKKLEIGLELGFYKDRLNLGLSWYQNRSSSQLVGYPLPALTGFGTVQANLPATVENTGLELEITSYNIEKELFNWQTSLNFTLPKNRLLEYPDLDQSSYANTYRVGYPLNILFLYQYNGLDPDTGLYTVVDSNGDGRIDIEDRTVIWDRGREFYGGISNNFNFRGFSLNFLFQFVKQEGRTDMFNAGSPSPYLEEVYEAITPGSHYQRISASLPANQAYSNILNSTFPIEDASFVRLKTLNIGYSLPEATLRNTALQDAKIFINGQNLMTFSSYKGLDPELPYGGRIFGQLRTVTAGLEVSF